MSLPIIAISGSQGSGKSTVIEALRNKGFGIVQRKTSRSILDEWKVTLAQVNNDRPLTVKFQDEIRRRKYNDESYSRQHVSASDIAVITERTYMDLATYACVAIGKDNEYSDWMSQYFRDCIRQTQTYDLVFYLTAGHFSIKEDGVRAINPLYSTMVDLTMQEFTKRAVLPGKLIFIDTPSLDERVMMIDTFTRTYLKQQRDYR
jgi:predicted ATPase